jgi:hypothetical protein
LLRGAVEGEREVVLLRDVGRALDPERPHHVPADVEAEDLASARLGLVGAVRELDTTRLAAAAGQYLGLDDDGLAELLRRSPGLLRRLRHTPLRHRDAVAPEELLALVLVEVHRPRGTLPAPR